MYTCGLPGGSVGKNLPAHAVDGRVAGSIPGWEGSPGGGNGNPLQCSCLKNSMDRGTWWVGYSPWGHKESDIIEHVSHTMADSLCCSPETNTTL